MQNWLHRHTETNQVEFISRGKLFGPKLPVLYERLFL